MATIDHPAWETYKAALERLARAGVRMEAARAMDAPDQDEAEQTFQDAMAAYDAARARLAAPAPSLFDGVPVVGSWWGGADLVFRATAPSGDGSDAEQG